MRWPNGSMTRPNVSSAFGPRAPGPGSSWHLGTDFTGCNPVRSIGGGVVKVVGTPSGWSAGGMQVWVQYDGFFARFMHLGSYNVSVGESVTEAAVLGAQDTTGTATGSHVHLEITMGTLHYSNSGQIDPVAFLASRISGNTASVGGDPDVAQLQLDLTTAGYPTTVDGDYGAGTSASVSAFQTDAGITVDGDAGPATKAKLAEYLTALQQLLVDNGYPLMVDGHAGPATIGAVRDYQGKHGLTVDGIIGYDTRESLKANAVGGFNAIENVRSTADVQKLVGATVDGIWGAETTAKVIAWQKAHPPLTADGIWGVASDAIGFPVVTAYIPIPATGEFDPALVRALQASLGFTGTDIDGDRGAKTITAQQIATGMTGEDVDGVDGPTTTRHLQASLGVRQDGQAGPLTFEALRALLNAGRKLLPGKVDPVEVPQAHPQPTAPEYPRADRWGWSVNSSPRTGRVQLVVAHHMGIWPAPSADAIWNTFMEPNGRSVSANLQINSDGSSFEPVPPTANRAWTTGQLDQQATTFEMMNATGPDGTPAWSFTAAALEEAAQYLAWNHKQFGVPLQRGKVTGTQDIPVVEIPGFVGHNETPAGRASGTTCPGSMPYDTIIARATQIVAPTPPPEPDPIDEFLRNLQAELRASADAIDEHLTASQ